MAGHSKWKNIMHKKEKTDAQRAKIFTKIGREISVCVREGGPDPLVNGKLRDLIAKAKGLNVPNDNISRVIQKAGADTTDYEALNYEGYGPGGVAVLVEVLTDNRNRTAGEMRHYFDKYGGNLGSPGSVAWQFHEQGLLLIEPEGVDADELLLAALEAGAADLEQTEDAFEITCTAEAFPALEAALAGAGFAIASAEVTKLAQSTVSLESEEQIAQMEKLLDLLEENDDVQHVYHNWED